MNRGGHRCRRERGAAWQRCWRGCYGCRKDRSSR